MLGGTGIEQSSFIQYVRQGCHEKSLPGSVKSLASSLPQSNLQYSTFAVALRRVTPSYRKGNRPI